MLKLTVFNSQLSLLISVKANVSNSLSVVITCATDVAQLLRHAGVFFEVSVIVHTEEYRNLEQDLPRLLLSSFPE